jgi:hypothetical protein
MTNRFPHSNEGFKTSLGDSKWIVHRTQARWHDTNHPDTFDATPPTREYFTPTVRDMYALSGEDFNDSGGSDDTSDLYFVENRWHGSNVIKLLSNAEHIASSGSTLSHVLGVPKCAKETSIILRAQENKGTWPTHDDDDEGAIQFYFSLVYEDGSETPEIIGSSRNGLNQNTVITSNNDSEDDANDGWISSSIDGVTHSIENGALDFQIQVGIGNHASPNESDTWEEGIPDNIYLNHGGSNDGTTLVQQVACPTGVGDGNKYSTSDYMSRISGFRMYWNHSGEEPNERWLLFDVNYEKGIRLPGQLTFKPWSGKVVNSLVYDHDTNFPGITNGYKDDQSVNPEDDKWPAIYYGNYAIEYRDGERQMPAFSIGGVLIKDPPRIERFEDINGYSRSEGLSKVKYGTAVLVHNRLYVGRVNVDGKLYSDRIMRSAPGQFDVFPSESFVDLQESDGDAIIHLETFGDRLLCFKKRKLLVLNVSTDATELIEGEYDFKGVDHMSHVCKTDYGVAFFNSSSVYLYDGEGVIDLAEKENITLINKNYLKKILGTKESLDEIGVTSSLISKDCRIGYDGNDKKLIIIGRNRANEADNVYVEADNNLSQAIIYDMVNQSWSYSNNIAGLYNILGKMTYKTNLLTMPNLQCGFIGHFYLSDGGIQAPVWAGWNSNDNLMNLFPRSYEDTQNDGWDEGAGGVDTASYWKKIWVSKTIDFGTPSQVKKLYTINVGYYVPPEYENVNDPYLGTTDNGWKVGFALEYTDRDGNSYIYNDYLTDPTASPGRNGTRELDEIDDSGFLGFFNASNGYGELLFKSKINKQVTSCRLLVMQNTRTTSAAGQSGETRGGLPPGFYINDIDIVYREKPLR